MQLVRVLESLTLHDLLGEGGLVPLVFGCFVAANVDELRGKQLAHFGQYILEETEGFFLRGEDVRVDAPAGHHLGRVARDVGVAELRVGGDGRRGMAGHLDLRHDRDVALGRVGDDLLDFLLGVKPAVALAVVAVAVAVWRCGITETADFRQLRVLPDLDPPALIFC